VAIGVGRPAALADAEELAALDIHQMAVALLVELGGADLAPLAGARNRSPAARERRQTAERAHPARSFSRGRRSTSICTRLSARFAAEPAVRASSGSNRPPAVGSGCSP